MKPGLLPQILTEESLVGGNYNVYDYPVGKTLVSVGPTSATFTTPLATIPTS